MVTKSEILFVFGCIPVRSLLALYARENPHPILIAMGLMYAIRSIQLWLKPSLRPSGPETFGAPIWWNSMRPIHALLWLLFVISALMKKEYAWKFLALDVVLGLSSVFFLKYN